MNFTIEALYREIAQIVFDHQPQVDWQTSNYVYKGITLYSVGTGFHLSAKGEKIYFSGGRKIADVFKTLRGEMAALHDNGHAWYTATCIVTPAGKFTFDFDYDHLPTFDIMPDPMRWVDEFKTYPRPELQAHVQDWIDGKVTDADNGDVKMVERLKKLQGQ